MEEVRKVDTYETKRKCSCGKGYMQYTGSAFSTIKTVYDHVCNSCGKHEPLDKKYPYLYYVPEPRTEG